MRLLIFLSLMTVCCAGSLEFDCKLLVHSPVIRSDDEGLDNKKSPLDISGLILITNLTSEPVTIATEAFDSEIEDCEGGLQLVLRWEIPLSWKGTPLIRSESAIQKVTIYPTESASITARLPVAAVNIRRIIKIKGIVDKRFSERYNVAALAWEEKVKKNERTGQP